MRDRKDGKGMNQRSRTVGRSEPNWPEQPAQPETDWVPLELPSNIEETLSHWAEYAGPKVGWCLLCDQPILREEDFIPETNTHNCPEGQRFHREHNH